MYTHFADCIPVGVLPSIEVLEPGEQLENGKFTKAKSVIKTRRVVIAPMPEARAIKVGQPAFRVFVFNEDELLWTQRFDSPETVEKWVLAEIEEERIAQEKVEREYQERKQLRAKARAAQQAMKQRHQESVEHSKFLAKSQLKLTLDITPSNDIAVAGD